MATTNGISKDLMKKIQDPNAVLGRQELRLVMGNYQDDITQALPLHLKKNAEKYSRQLFSLITLNPKLQECSISTLISALMTASSLGLDLTPQLGQCYIIPYSNSKRVGNEWTTITEAQFQLGFRGAITLAQRSGTVAYITAEVVHQKDRFRYSKGLDATVEHEESDEEDRGPITHVYALAKFVNGGYHFDVWPVNKVIAHAKKFSKSYYKDEYKSGKKTGNRIVNEKSPWHTDFEAMAKKTLIMAIWKFLPLSTELMLAATVDETIKDDLSRVENERDIITIAAKRLDDDTPSELEGAVEAPSALPGVFEEDQNLASIDSEMIPAETAPQTPKAGSVSELEKLRADLEDLLGSGNLDLIEPEQAEWLEKNCGESNLLKLKKDKLNEAIHLAQEELRTRDAEIFEGQ